MNDIILFKLGEIVLKGQNRRIFENRLMSNIRRRLKPFGDFKVYSLQSTIYAEPLGMCDMDGAIEAALTIFGANTVTRAASCEKDKDKIVEAACEYLALELEKCDSFKVESKRSDKKFPMSSIELSQYVGGMIHQRFPQLKPDMKTPELVVNVEIRDLAAYVHGPAQIAAGGLPVGVGGRMAALLSGGIDSPVAMQMMAKRGVMLIPVHFFSFPYTSQLAKEKVITIAQTLTRYCGRLMVEIVPFTQIHEEIRDNCPDSLATILSRRFMVRISEQIAVMNGCSALVTGDNLGQVASQTVEALAVIEECAGLPIMRPLLAFDKKEIVDRARLIGTYETSILPYEDCCAIFAPRRPKTKPRLEEILAAEAALDIHALVENAIGGIERIELSL